MKIRESLFAKTFATVFLLVLVVGMVADSAALVYMVTRYDVLETRYMDTSLCAQSMQQTAYQVDTYYQLKTMETEGKTLSYDQQSSLSELSAQLTDEGNFIWQVFDNAGLLLMSNLKKGDIDVSDLTEEGKTGRLDIKIESILSSDVGAQIATHTSTYRHIEYGLRKDMPYQDSFYTEGQKFIQIKEYFVPAILVAAGMGVLGILLFCFLVAAAGHKAGVEGIVLNWFDRIWIEPLAIGLIIILVLFYNSMYYGDLVTGVIWAISVSFYTLVSCFSLVRRAKAGVMHKTTMVYAVLHFLGNVMQHSHITVRVVGMLGVYVLTQAVAWSFTRDLFVFLIFSVPMMILFILAAIQYEKIKQATERMAEGNLGNVVDEKSVPFFVSMARDLNSSGKALTIAVENATSSERMKTELITNVSHDIKTPLTSIISYVGLLKTTDITDPKALEYIQVLEQKSKRLGQLMADLVEASKVTSGNVTVNMERINLGELIKQASGEYESRLEERGIMLMCLLPEEPVIIGADGRHMWRVLDNIFGNAVKYALDGTRVYVDLADIGNEVVLSIKNISRDALNIHPNELMERFVRGDQARNSEGSGLGLSIASSLMELQNGRMDIQIDGDLFKVILYMKKA